MNEKENASAPVRVSNHAVIRFRQRVSGFDRSSNLCIVQRIKEMIAGGEIIMQTERESRIKNDKLIFVLKPQDDGVACVITVWGGTVRTNRQRRNHRKRYRKYSRGHTK